MRYKRNRRYRRNSTNVIKMKFQSFMDIHTIKDQMQIISISAGGKELLQRLPAQFSAYKYYKIGNISVKLVPASTLPVDPSGLSYEAGEPGVDPRDQLTPGMMRITNGEDVFEDISGMTAEAQHDLYNSMMLDPRWYKWMLQSGVKRHALPRYWQIGQLHQDKWPGATINVPRCTLDSSSLITGVVDTDHEQLYTRSVDTLPDTGGRRAIYGQNDVGSFDLGFFQTGHKGILGWLPTDGMQFGQAFLTSPPEIEVFKIIMPPAYKTEYYYRAFISETVYFKEPVLMAVGSQFGGYRPLDVFHFARLGLPVPPNQVAVQSIDDTYTGGNYGDD